MIAILTVETPLVASEAVPVIPARAFSFSPVAGTVIAEAGAVLSKVKDILEEGVSLLPALSLAFDLTIYVCAVVRDVVTSS